MTGKNQLIMPEKICLHGEKPSTALAENVFGAEAAPNGTWPVFRNRSETALCACLLVLPPLLALAPRGAAPLAAAAGLCAAGMLLSDVSLRRRGFAAVFGPAIMLVGLLLWGALSAVWAVDPQRAIMLAAKLVTIFAAALVLAAAATRTPASRRVFGVLLVGTGVAMAIAVCDKASAGALTHLVTARPFTGARLNQIAVWLALLVQPVAVLLARRRLWYGIVAGGAIAAVVFLLDGTAAKVALMLSLPLAALVWLQRRLICRVAAVLSVVVILTAPLTFPRFDDIPAALASASQLKVSAAHRLLIWSFAGERIGERPLLGWGLDASRAIPGGDAEILPGLRRMPLHPHNAALQVWLELGAPGALIFALFVGLLWWRLAVAPWPRANAAAAGGSLAGALAISFAGWGIWQEWWLGMLGMTAFAIINTARTAAGAQHHQIVSTANTNEFRSSRRSSTWSC